MSVRVAINGFGRIGRNILRAAVEAGRNDIEILAINDLAPVETNAHLLRYDSVHGRFKGEIKTGDSWLHLRMCLSCGHVACCDSSPNQHASKHFRRSRHPLMRSVEPGEGWIWCFVDEIVPGELPPVR